MHVSGWNYAAARDVGFLIHSTGNVGADRRKREMFLFWRAGVGLQERTEKGYPEG